ncbi:MAG: cation:dicarboxylase symporter family transporter, partial [Methylomonas lenta]|nr:cation:dicarboxylase symporter family transporter [Methylomonas lenta]
MLNKLSFSSKVLLALLFGIITGIVFGERVAWLNIVGTAFIKLLQIPVIPYIFLSLVVGLGSLSVNQAKEIAKKFGLMLVIFWTLGLLVVFALSLSFPEWQSSQFFNATQITLPAEINYFDLYIPSNPFKSFSEGTIPAVVIFSGFLGLALINIENKEYFLAPAKTLIDALSKITKTTITLLPLGIFTLSAAAAGTLYPDDFEKLQIYFLLFIVAALILSLWVMPLFVSAITPFKYRDIVQDCRDILVTAFATGNLFILLPTIIETCNDIFKKY